MAAPYPGPVSAIQVGSYFVAQYYRVLQQQPDLVHQFYSDASTMIRVDGDVSETATTMRRIHNIIMSLNFAAIEIKTINSIESWNGGVLVMVSGSVKTKDFSGRKNFVHTFFLAPQETGYFVLNDIFQFIDSEVVYQQQPTTTASESIYQQHAAPSANDHIYQEHHAPSTNDHIYQQHQDQVTSESFYQQHTPEDTLDGQLNASDNFAEAPVEETIPEETPSFQGAVDVVHEPPTSAVDEPAEEPSKKTWASILKVAKGPQSSVVAQPQAQPPVIKSAPAPSDWNHVSAPVAQQTDAGLSVLPEPANDVAEDGFDVDEGEFKSVYVRNLPSDITAAEIEQEFRNFGRISPDGVFVRNRKDVIGVCYAFVEFEDLVSVQNAIKSSPIQLAGRQVYIEERRPTGGIASRGGTGGRGRGRGGYPTEAPRGRYGGGRGLGRSSNQDNGEYNNRSRGNGYPQRSTR
ncbi:Nuclear transport factor 2 [Linum perenne]